MPQKNIDNEYRFKMTFWFIVGIVLFGAIFTVFLVLYLPAPAAERIAEIGHTFWLSSAVAGGIGYLLGSSANKHVEGKENRTGTTTADVSLTATVETKPEQKQNEPN